jgi:hypothetical protein
LTASFRGHLVRSAPRTEATFGPGRATAALNALELFLSFAFGATARPLHAHGFDRNGEAGGWVRLDVSPPLPMSGPHRVRTWLPVAGDLEQDSEGVDLSSAFDGLISIARTNAEVYSTLRRAIEWYVAALAAGGKSSSIVLAQAGLELLAWRRITGQMRLSEKGRRALDVADQLRLLLNGTGIPLEVPRCLATLVGTVSDGPEAVTLARNRVVHPRPDTGRTRLSDSQATEAQRLAIWYLEMLLLKQLHHDSIYWDRLQKKVMRVPWS